MKKIVIVFVLAAIATVGCKKKENTVSMVVTASTPIVTITGPQYFSIPIGGALPNITAVAYDTFYRDSLSVVIDQKGLDNTTPGLYTIFATAKNKYGYIGSASVYVAVTNITNALDLSGWYLRSGNPNRVAFVTKIATGLFRTSNVGGVDTTTGSGTGPIISAVFAVTSTTTAVSGTTSIDFGSQNVVDNGVLAPLTASSEALSITTAPVDTSLIYAIQESSFGTQVRTFVKQ